MGASKKANRLADDSRAWELSISGWLNELRDLAFTRDWANHTRQSNKERIDRIADGIEEALRSYPGNAAALRYALEIALDNPCGPGTDDPLECAEFNCAYQDEPHGSAGDECPWKKIRRAMSRPTRNCDLFGGDKYKLHSLWWNWTGTKDGQNEDGTAKLTFGEWLLEESDKECSTASRITEESND